MSREQLLAIVAILAVGVMAWDQLRPRGAEAPDEVVAQPAAAQRTPEPAPAPAPPLRGPSDMGVVPNFLRPAAVSASAVSALAREFGDALDYKPLFDRLYGTTEGATPEGQYFLYRILRACASVAERKGAAATRSRTATRLAERRQEIEASLPEGDPRRAQRLEAFDKATADPCASLGGLSVAQAELAQILRNALDGGDPKARAWQVEQDMWKERRAASTPGRAGPTLDDTQLASLREALSSRDPEAIAIAGRVLANSFRDLTVRIGPDREVAENRALMNAALLLACEYGYSCGENNSRVLGACAFQGHCGVASLPDYLFYYGASPYDAQLLDRYRTVLRQAVETGDWSAIAIERGSRSPVAPPLSGMSPYHR